MGERMRHTHFKCARCGNASLVRSNFRLTPDGKAFCASAKRPECEEARKDHLEKRKGSEG
jgi:ssDNA-binding Zn-finger/Zn-ribbon topoisomerase 1